ncbi:hypothetical protein [Helicobacter pylori]|uniref:hypothetical protein n=1 Tax=Helicobacter pylori TaxID=210 RepID=UPI002AC7CB7B|nr:hypothetical protein [Helicobacter pylori]MDZ5288571.1 hypothetical protein [Helicobacter pylori]
MTDIIETQENEIQELKHCTFGLTMVMEYFCCNRKDVLKDLIDYVATYGDWDKPHDKHPTIEGAKLAVMKEITAMQYGNEVGDIAEQHISKLSN